MASRLITPPEKFNRENSYLIINAHKAELDTLVLWLKTVPTDYDFYFYHDQMSEKTWPEDVAYTVKKILVNRDFEDLLHSGLKLILDDLQDRIVHFGSKTQYPILVKYFFDEHKKLDLF